MGKSLKLHPKPPFSKRESDEVAGGLRNPQSASLTAPLKKEPCN